MKKDEARQEQAEPAAEAREAEARAEEACRCNECPVQTLAGFVKEADAVLRGIVPEEFWQHRRAARREALLALRSLLDAAIEHVDKEPVGRARRQPTKISIA